MPPIRHLARVRPHRLAELLAETDLPIGVAMKQAAWNSRGHAAHQLTSIIGVNPPDYRREAGWRNAAKDRGPVALETAPQLTLRAKTSSYPGSG